MRPKERHRTGQADIFRSRLDQIVDMRHPLVLLAGKIDRGFLEAQFGAVYTDRPGRPPLPTRLMAGFAILKSMHDLSDEALCDRWVENPYFQLFCGEEFFQHRLQLLQQLAHSTLLQFNVEHDVDPFGQQLWTAIAEAIETFKPSECANYFAAAGYDAYRSENALV